MAISTPTVKVFEVNQEVVGDRNVAVVANNENMVVLAHVWQKGGETALHSHHSSDASWVVVQGQVTFYGEGDSILGKLERGGGIFIPRNTKYWFESTADEPLMMIRSASKNGANTTDDRVYA